MSAPKCTSWLGHKFEARYSISNPAWHAFLSRAVKIASVSNVVIEAMQEREYHCDICVRCGFVVEHKTDKSSSGTTI